jgi:hypothetical protein
MPPAPEPYLSVRGVAAAETKKSRQEQLNEEISSAEEEIICSKVSALGDFVDTDAASSPDFLSISLTAAIAMANYV